MMTLHCSVIIVTRASTVVAGLSAALAHDAPRPVDLYITCHHNATSQSLWLECLSISPYGWHKAITEVWQRMLVCQQIFLAKTLREYISRQCADVVTAVFVRLGIRLAIVYKAISNNYHQTILCWLLLDCALTGIIQIASYHRALLVSSAF